MKRFFSLLLFASLLLCLTACGEKQPEHTHRWDPANCRRGELCLICGKTQGDTQDHKWGPANCTRGEYCASCGGTQGEALGHDWADATCTVAKRCARCGLTEGSSLGHAAQGSFCTRCNETLNTVVKMNEYSKELPLVYGGVEVVYSLYGGLNGYPKEFVIYDQNGTKVASRSWPSKIPYLTGEKDEKGRWLLTEYANTEFVPLEPGAYQMEFSYYERRNTPDEWNLDAYIYPARDIATKWFTLTVR